MMPNSALCLDLFSLTSLHSLTQCVNHSSDHFFPITSSFSGVVELVLKFILTPGAAPLKALLSCEPSSSGHRTGMGSFLCKGFSVFGLTGSAAPPSVCGMFCQSGSTLTRCIMFTFPSCISHLELLLICTGCAKNRSLCIHTVMSALKRHPLVTHMLFPVISKLQFSYQVVSS